MSQPMIVWCVIAGALLLTFVLRAVGHRYASVRQVDRKPRRFIEMGKDRDMFFIPGDVDEEDDEFDD